MACRVWVLGRWFGDFLAPEYVERFKERFPRFKAAGETHGFQFEFVRKDGAHIFVEIDGRIGYDAEGKFKQTHCVLGDITERRRANEELLLYQQQLRALASELSLSEERERRQIASDLHDGTSQNLALAKMKLVSVQNSAREDELVAALNEIGEMIDEALTQTRSLTFELSPPVLYRMGLEPALAALARQMEEKHGLNVALDMNTEPTPLPGDLRVTLFRAIQELLINVVKHAHTRQVHVSLWRKGRQIIVEVADRGRGYMPTDVSHPGGKTGGFGLFSIRERLNYLGGSLDIQAQVGGGTRVILTAPLPVEKTAKEESQS